MDGQIARQSSSYRQGLVLGLTMAEILLLLVFCLLIALATFLRLEQQKRANAEAERDTAKSELALYRSQERSAGNGEPTIVEKFNDWAKTNGITSIDDGWRELVDSNNIVAQLKATGISVDEFKSRLNDSKRLSEKSLDADKAIAKMTSSVISASPLRRLSPASRCAYSSIRCAAIHLKSKTMHGLSLPMPLARSVANLTVRRSNSAISGVRCSSPSTT